MRLARALHGFIEGKTMTIVVIRSSLPLDHSSCLIKNIKELSRYYLLNCFLFYLEISGEFDDLL